MIRQVVSPKASGSLEPSAIHRAFAGGGREDLESGVVLLTDLSRLADGQLG